MGHPTRSALTFEVAIGAVVVHAGRLVAIEQRTGAGEVAVRDLVTGMSSTVEVGTLRGNGSDFIRGGATPEHPERPMRAGASIPMSDAMPSGSPWHSSVRTVQRCRGGWTG